MIVYPRNWEQIGTAITKEEVEERILDVIQNTCCNHLALSGGLDSSLLLYFMRKIYTEVEAFTIGESESHPDVRYARLVTKEFEKVKHRVYIPTKKEIAEEEDFTSDIKGDKATRMFYRFIWKYTNRIISGDGADEFNAGYYGHQAEEVERPYYEYIRKLQKEQLEPLNKNSRQVKVYLPYLDKGLLYLLCQIPLAEKVNKKERKIFIVGMAKGKIPNAIIERRKYGFCDALKIKKAKNGN